MLHHTVSTQGLNAFLEKYSDPLQAQREYSKHLYARGEFGTSVSYWIGVIHGQVQLLQAALAKSKDSADSELGTQAVNTLNQEIQTISQQLMSDFFQLFRTLDNLREFSLGLRYSLQALQFFPENPGFMFYQAIFSARLGEFEKGCEILAKLHANEPNNVTVLDGFAAVSSLMGKTEQAAEIASKAMQAKHEQAMAAENVLRLRKWLDKPFVLSGSPKPFNAKNERKNIIAYSLWGNNEYYWRPAILNAQMVNSVYPGWTSRFYCANSVPGHVLDELLQVGAQVIMMGPIQHAYAGLFWRFLVANDPNVERFLVRDCDSIINCQERIAVDEWLETDKFFHIMRAQPAHSEIILAGLWGGVGGVLPNIQPLINKFYESENIDKTIDQRFLRMCVWPLIKGSVHSHDDFSDFQQPARFSELGAFPKQTLHVGSTWQDHIVKNVPAAYEKKFQAKLQTKHCVFTLSAGRCGNERLAKVLEANLQDATVFHNKISALNMPPNAECVSQLAQFNLYGNTKALQAHWRQTLLSDILGDAECYVETSHIPCKAGLLENLALLQAMKVKTTIVCLHCDVSDNIWRFINNFDFVNTALTWMVYLNPQYPNRIVQPKAYLEHDMIGYILWYCREMRARTHYYQMLFQGNNDINIVHCSEQALSETESTKQLLSQLGYSSDNIILPEQVNIPENKFFADGLVDSIHKLVETIADDSHDQAQSFFDSGQRLANPKYHA